MKDVGKARRCILRAHWYSTTVKLRHTSSVELNMMTVRWCAGFVVSVYGGMMLWCWGCVNVRRSRGAVVRSCGCAVVSWSLIVEPIELRHRAAKEVNISAETK